MTSKFTELAIDCDDPEALARPDWLSPMITGLQCRRRWPSRTCPRGGP